MIVLLVITAKARNAVCQQRISSAGGGIEGILPCAQEFIGGDLKSGHETGRRLIGEDDAHASGPRHANFCGCHEVG